MSAGRRLARALEASARAAGCRVAVASLGERPWSSATFVGARHVLTVAGEPAAAMADWLAGLADAVPVVPGHLVADLTVNGRAIEALVLVAAPSR